MNPRPLDRKSDSPTVVNHVYYICAVKDAHSWFLKPPNDAWTVVRYKKRTDRHYVLVKADWSEKHSFICRLPGGTYTRVYRSCNTSFTALSVLVLFSELTKFISKYGYVHRHIA